jgi:MATE family multidrug resistance protein
MYLPYIWIIPLASFAAFLWDGIYIGSTATRALRNVMIVSSIVFFVLLIIMKSSNHVLWIAFVLFLLARGLGLGLASPKAIFYTIDKKS